MEQQVTPHKLTVELIVSAVAQYKQLILFTWMLLKPQ